MKNITLKDMHYHYNNISLTLFLTEVVRNENEASLFYFDVKVTYDHHTQYSKCVLFDNELHHLVLSESETPIQELYFIEPELSFTIIKVEHRFFCMYINFDSGINYSQVATESGLAIKINVTPKQLNIFLSELRALKSFIL
ncbi:hypothetical protein [Staphylococcus sp. 17KM0847]|uniref:hypothetical protein n=1 Tax=Staphylococcus sp. 17KM0847 TaxID=2583989 RepID=UPI0015DBFE73|nr:hypothetical protein [Staphylococcus sp. 17KM0847]QLK86448.1 hypothetical protein FGL66_06955 [Staphylococcus sp. 17KM0847]